jgi:hypothetical protein
VSARVSCRNLSTLLVPIGCQVPELIRSLKSSEVEGASSFFIGSFGCCCFVGLWPISGLIGLMNTHLFGSIGGI